MFLPFGKEKIVLKKSTNFLNRVSNRLTISDQTGGIREAILKRCMTERAKGIKEYNDPNCIETDAKQVKSEIMRLLKLAHQVLNANENRGMMGLRPHDALSVGKNGI